MNKENISSFHRPNPLQNKGILQPKQIFQKNKPLRLGTRNNSTKSKLTQFGYKIIQSKLVEKNGRPILIDSRQKESSILVEKEKLNGNESIRIIEESQETIQTNSFEWVLSQSELDRFFVWKTKHPEIGRITGIILLYIFAPCEAHILSHLHDSCLD